MPSHADSKMEEEKFGMSVHFGEWYFALQLDHNMENSVHTSTDTSSSVAFRDELLHFKVIALGEDRDNMTILTASCISSSFGDTFDIFDKNSTPTITTTSSTSNEKKHAFMGERVSTMEKLVRFDIIHQAAMTENVLKFLESRIDGLAFMCHVGITVEGVQDENDAEFLHLSSKLCLHPYSSNQEYSFSEEIPANSFGLGKDNSDSRPGSILGIDLDVTHTLITAYNSSMIENSRIPFDFELPMNLCNFLRYDCFLCMEVMGIF